MNREVSSYLDYARVLAAFMIMVEHVQLNWASVWHVVVPLGNDSVAVLFVISGFVISHASSSRESTLKDYLIRRAARLYSILVPCMMLCLLLDFTGQYLMPHFYHESWPQLDSKVGEVLDGLYSLTFLGRAKYGLGWVLGGTPWPGSMVPYWTLPYEVAYYLLFGAAWYLRGWRRLLMLAVVGAITGPVGLVFLPLWLIGVLTHRLHLSLKLSAASGRYIFFGALLVFLAGEAITEFTGLSFGFNGQISLALWPYYAAGLLFAVLTIGFYFSGFVISRYSGWVKWLAGASATLYLLHFPLGRFIAGFLPHTIHSRLRALLIILPVIAIALGVAQFSERRKDVWRRQIEAGLDRAGGFFQQRRLAMQKDS